MAVEATITARRYVEYRGSNVVLLGSRDHDSTFTVRWDLVLSDEPGVPWRIVRIHQLGPRTGPRAWLTQLSVEIFEVISEITGRRH